MLIEFTVGNYRSFKDPVTFSMVAAKLTARDKTLDENNVFPLTDKISLLKSCALYGANASGKSNLIHAVRFMRYFVLNSAYVLSAAQRRVWGSIDDVVVPFLLSTETTNEPSFFEIVFFSDAKRYRYGFIIDAKKVYSEWLYYVPKVKETLLFFREGDDFKLPSVFKEGKGLPDKTRDNALFLSVVAQFNGEIALMVLQWFMSLTIKFSVEGVDQRETVASLKDESLREEIISLIKKVDLGIADIELRLEPHREQFSLFTQGDEVFTIHKIFDTEKSKDSSMQFDIDTQESEGTKKLFALAGPILDILRNGKVLIIDELDARLHPLLTEAIIRLFNSNETNPNNAQLIFTTHDTNLLTNKLFRRDQIWFTEKNKFGATDLYSLAEFKGVRSDASYEKDYITGRYGAIPFIGGLHRLIGRGDG